MQCQWQCNAVSSHVSSHGASDPHCIASHTHTQCVGLNNSLGVAKKMRTNAAGLRVKVEALTAELDGDDEREKTRLQKKVELFLHRHAQALASAQDKARALFEETARSAGAKLNLEVAKARIGRVQEQLREGKERASASTTPSCGRLLVVEFVVKRRSIF